MAAAKSAVAKHDSTPLPTPRLEIKLLGSFELARFKEGNNKDTPLRLPTRKIESLLAYLALYPEPHSREKLAALFWGDVRDEQARLSLRYALAMLRKQLGGDLLLADREMVQLNPEFPIWVDAREFKDEIKRMKDESKLSSLVPDLLSLTLYRGDLLADFYDDWILPEREQYRQLYVEVLLQLTQHYRSTSEYARSIETAHLVLQTDSANERAHQHLMFCFLALGNRNAALQQYKQCVVALRDELAIDPAPETTALYEWIKQTPSETPSFAARITNLPIPLTSFIGREKEMAEMKGLLKQDGRQTTNDQSEVRPLSPIVRLLTLTGAGGSGKTRLAIQVATDLIDAYRDGVWWVELGALTDDAQMSQAVAKALGVRESAEQSLIGTLEYFLRDKELLLVMDNCEHLLDACVHLARTLLGACARLQMLTTSREPLGFIGETVRQISTLAFPDPNVAPLTELLMQYEAVRLFVERGRAANARFELGAENAIAIAQICARLDGIPLALELAAARLYEMPLQEITARLDDRFNFLTRGNRGALPRQQTLSALIAWSYDLLSEAEQSLFRRLSVFAGTFATEAVEQVVAPFPSKVPEVLAHLATKSLLNVEYSDKALGFRMLETIRKFGQDQLAASGEEYRTRSNHLVYFTKVAEMAANLEQSDVRESWFLQLEKSHEDVRAALQWANAHSDFRALLQFCGALERFWEARSYYDEGRRWLLHALEMNRDATTTSKGDPELRRYFARALWSLGDLMWLQSDYAQGENLIAAALEIYKETGDQRQIAGGLHRLGGIVYERGDYEAARRLYEKSLAIFREINDLSGIADTLAYVGLALLNQSNYDRGKEFLKASLALQSELGNSRGIAYALNLLGKAAVEENEYETAVCYFQESLVLHRELANTRSMASLHNNLATVYTKQGNFAIAHELARLSLKLYKEVGSKRGYAYAFSTRAHLAYAEGELEFAVELFSMSNVVLRHINGHLDAQTQQGNAKVITEIAARLDGDQFRYAWERGQLRSVDQAVEWALSEKD